MTITPPITGKPWIKVVGQQSSMVSCVGCGKDFHIPIPARHVQSWVNGQLIQVAMPQLTNDERELFISGTCGECWEKL